MKKVNSNISMWILSSMGAVAIALSIIVSLPTVSKANTSDCSATCADGSKVSCSGSNCAAIDGVGCSANLEKGQTPSTATCPQV